LFFPYAKFDIAGTEHIPAVGPAIIVGNHRSYFDVGGDGVTIAKTERTVRFLGKKEVFDAPVVGQIASAMGGIRVDRGTGSDEPLQAAAEALQRRHGGDDAAGHDPARQGVLRPEAQGPVGRCSLAALTKAPVIPVGLWGTEKVWPRSARCRTCSTSSNRPGHASPWARRCR
jgi:putative phosphoserine phosphatase/1-acylglycerol-3-phosphate O-acyltransferase